MDSFVRIATADEAGCAGAPATRANAPGRVLDLGSEPGRSARAVAAEAAAMQEAHSDDAFEELVENELGRRRPS